MGSVRGLLAQGNSKLGQAIFRFDLPPVSTCPGRSKLCTDACYAKTGRYRFSFVKKRLAWCFQQSQRGDFADAVVAEIKKKGILVLRIHCSGDFYSVEYARKWLDVMRRCPKVRFYFYTRSHKIPEIAEVLEEMAALRCCRIWYSIDKEMGIPAKIPRGVRLAYLQVTADEEPELLDLLFVVRRLKNHARRVQLPLLCPHQAEKEESCGSCGRCFR